jgi:hypothetical protein
VSRETREGWPLLTVETEVKRESKRTNERGPFLVGTREFRYALAALVGPVQNIFFLSVHCFNYFVPIAEQAGQAAVLGRLSLSMCLCCCHLSSTFNNIILVTYILRSKKARKLYCGEGT